jgi:hypothetical protein
LAVFEAGAIASDKYEPSAGIYRIMGLPGDEIRFDDGPLKINNRPVTLTPNGTVEYSLAEGKVKRALVFTETLPDGTRYKIAQNPDDQWFWQDWKSFRVPPSHPLIPRRQPHGSERQPVRAVRGEGRREPIRVRPDREFARPPHVRALRPIS